MRQIEEMKAEKSDLTTNLTQLEIENKKLSKELQRVEKERDNVLSRKEMVSGENMQLIMEAEQSHQIKADLSNQLRTAQNRIRDLEKENSNMKFEYENKMIDQQAERYASLVEKNKNLTDWREQLIEKNRLLTEENRKLAERCSNLEELLNEEETDINVVLGNITRYLRRKYSSPNIKNPFYLLLGMIQTMQMTGANNSTSMKQSNGVGGGKNSIGSSNNFISSKLRDFK